jgi:hypothetical protein
MPPGIGYNRGIVPPKDEPERRGSIRDPYRENRGFIPRKPIPIFGGRDTRRGGPANPYAGNRGFFPPLGRIPTETPGLSPFGRTFAAFSESDIPPPSEDDIISGSEGGGGEGPPPEPPPPPPLPQDSGPVGQGYLTEFGETNPQLFRNLPNEMAAPLSEANVDQLRWFFGELHKGGGIQPGQEREFMNPPIGQGAGAWKVWLKKFANTRYLTPRGLFGLMRIIRGEAGPLNFLPPPPPPGGGDAPVGGGDGNPTGFAASTGAGLFGPRGPGRPPKKPPLPKLPGLPRF